MSFPPKALMKKNEEAAWTMQCGAPRYMDSRPSLHRRLPSLRIRRLAGLFSGRASTSLTSCSVLPGSSLLRFSTLKASSSNPPATIRLSVEVPKYAIHIVIPRFSPYSVFPVTYFPDIGFIIHREQQPIDMMKGVCSDAICSA